MASQECEQAVVALNVQWCSARQIAARRVCEHYATGRLDPSPLIIYLNIYESGAALLCNAVHFRRH